MSARGIQTAFIEFASNHALLAVVGSRSCNIEYLEKKLSVSIALKGNKLAISGTDPEITYARLALDYLVSHFLKENLLLIEDVDAAVRLVTGSAKFHNNNMPEDQKEVSIPTRRRTVYPRSLRQADYIRMMQACDLVFGLGPAGTGKTYLAVAYGVSLLLNGQIDRIILSRPAIEAGERLGFLPGDMKEKIDPYLRPLYDALYDMLPIDQVARQMVNGEIEIAPLAFMRGRTLSNAFVILDEAQNTTVSQMKMFLTRLGANSRMVVTGDLTQIDLPSGVLSGLKDALQALEGIKEIGYTLFQEEDVMRHVLVSKIVSAYDNHIKNHPKAVDR